jgi:putative acetyltransferase
MEIVAGDLDDPRVIALMTHHLDSARAATAPGSAHALDLTGLRSPDIDFRALWDGDTLVAVGALMRIGPDHGEIKSMHTARPFRRTGAGGAMLRHLVALAREKGFTRVSLETGSWDFFRPAIALYAMHGFTECPPFGAYGPDPNSVFMTLELDPAAP